MRRSRICGSADFPPLADSHDTVLGFPAWSHGSRRRSVFAAISAFQIDKLDSIPRHHEEVVAVEIEVPGLDRRLLHDAQAGVLGKHCYGFRRDEVMVLHPERLLARERLPATRSLEVCRVQERMPARFEDAPDLLEVLPHQMEIEMHEHIKGEQEVDRVV